VTATELYERDEYFRKFVAYWVEHRRCPLELVDYLLDRDMSGPAECARWAHEGDEWEVFEVTRLNPDPVSGRFPYGFRATEWAFTVADDAETNWAGRCHRVPASRVRGVRSVSAPTPARAIVKLMDAWVPVPTSQSGG